MVKHAAREQEPLLTAEERVNRAIETIMAGQQFTKEQVDWLERIRVHTIENLSVNQEDFDEAPVLSRAGGWANANRVFGGKLPQLLKQINTSVAA